MTTAARFFEHVLAAWLEAQRMSPEQAAPHLGVGHVAIYAWLNGHYQPSNTKISFLARAMGLDESELRVSIERSRERRQRDWAAERGVRS